ncbi:TauD/TfdA family dioxygenase [Streptomyces sp. NPDC047315]|uniref:TauD/TfdA family dioxygenase n=1 Tax=Streptomyces sp. NPDC047315 TaxID=3155142 RepID=UPI0033C8F07E
MTGATIGDVGWTSEYLQSTPGVWSMSVSDEDRRLLWADASARRWDAGGAAHAAVRGFIRSSLDAVGFVNVRNLMSPAASEAELSSALTYVLAEVGTPVPQNARGDLWTVLRDRDGDGATALGFHCDTCDLLCLLCLQPAADGGGVTKLASARHVQDIIERERPDVLELLRQDWTFDRTGRAGEQIVVSPILFTQDDGTVGCYYQTRTVRSSAELDPRRLGALDFLDEVLYRPEIAFGLHLEAGDLLMIRNSRVLHGRSPYVDEPGPAARRVLRAWMAER